MKESKEKYEKSINEIFPNKDNISVPVDLVEIAKRIGIANIFSVDENIAFSGSLIKRNKIYEIRVNNNHSHARQRFTVAHEIAHYLLHKHILDKKNEIDDFDVIVIEREGNNSLSRREEAEANELAAMILMPEDIVWNKLQEFIKKHGGRILKDEAVDFISETFKVSTQSANIRLDNILKNIN